MRYGTPYKGSKNFIAEWIVNSLPKKKNFVDLFAGGCAVTHCAMTKNKYENYIANDISPSVLLFKDAVDGKYKNETRWISREDFFRLKDADPYVRYCWSFGNDGRTYLYGRAIEPYKRACHYAIVFDEWKEFKALCPEVFEVAFDALKGKTDIHERRLQFAPPIVKELKRLNNWNVVQKNPLYKSCHWRGGGLHGKHNDLQSLQSLQRLTVFQDDYRNVTIPEDSVIYCDIPYKGTRGYNGADFDHEAFYGWAERQSELVYISEYDMPRNRFECVAEKEKTVTLCAIKTNIRTERLFVPKTQAKRIIKVTEARYVQKEFDFF